MENNKCEYRNCGMVLVGKRKGAKFCSRSCKSNERKYNKREELKEMRDKVLILDMLKLVMNKNESEIIELNKIINK